jgi:uncharacterized protein (DUF488 family)
VEIFTIGFTKKNAAQFFGALREANVQQLVDVRLNNLSQLAGFTKRDDLAFFMAEICQGDYRHEPLLAPTQPLLDHYKKGGASWSQYERGFVRLLADRRVDECLDRSLFEPRTVLLCSEPTAERCHRRLVVEYLNERWGDIAAVHL